MGALASHPLGMAASLGVARHPLDTAVSFSHQSLNINGQRIAELTGNPNLARPTEMPPLDGYLVSWIASDSTARVELDQLRDAMNRSSPWDRTSERASRRTPASRNLRIDAGQWRQACARSFSRPPGQEPLLPFRPIRSRHRRPGVRSRSLRTTLEHLEPRYPTSSHGCTGADHSRPYRHQRATAETVRVRHVRARPTTP